MVPGTFIVNSLPAKVLFGAGATHFLINPEIAKQYACYLDETDTQLCVTTPVGSLY